MLRFKIKDLKKITESFNDLVSRDLTIATAWDLSEIQSVFVEKEETYNEMVNKIIDKYAEKDSNGKIVIEDGNYSIKKDKLEDFQKQIEELLNVEFVIELEKIHIDRLIKSDGKPIDISSNTLFNLRQILVR